MPVEKLARILASLILLFFMLEIAFTPDSRADGNSTQDNPVLYQLLSAESTNQLTDIMGFPGSEEFGFQMEQVKLLLIAKWLQPILYFFFLLATLELYNSGLPKKFQIILLTFPLLISSAFLAILLYTLVTSFHQSFLSINKPLQTLYICHLVAWPMATLLFVNIWQSQGYFAVIIYLLCASLLPFASNLYPINYQLSEALFPLSLIYLQSRYEVIALKKR